MSTGPAPDLDVATEARRLYRERLEQERAKPSPHHLCEDCGPRTGNTVLLGSEFRLCAECHSKEVEHRDGLAEYEHRKAKAAEHEDNVDAAHAAAGQGRRIVGRTAASVVPAPVKWAWQDRVPLGSVTLVVGREGVGKGVLSTWMAARWSRGQLLGDLHGEPVNVAILSIEDSAEYVLRPRLEAAGAALERVLFLHAEHGDAITTVEFPGDIDALSAYVVAHHVKVLVVDVPTAFLAGNVDSHKDHEVRRGLMTPLGVLAERFGIAVVINHHLNRAPSTVVLDRIAGSLGVSRAARAVLAVVENPEEPTERVVLLAKSNLGVLEVPGLRFAIRGAEVDTPSGLAKTGQVAMLGETASVTARNALRPREDEEERSAHDEAVEVLRGLLSAGPMPAKVVKRLATEAGIAKRTLDRAKKSLGVVSVKVGKPGDKEQGWTWELPEGCQPVPKNHEDRHVETLASFDDLGILREP